MEYVYLKLANPKGNWWELGEITDDRKKATILVVDFNTNVTLEFLRDFPKLKVVASPTTGHTHIKVNPSIRDIKLITLKGNPRLSEVRSVAEYTFKLLLDFVRPQEGVHRTLSSKTLGIVGFGRIGKQVCEIAQGFKMTTLYFDTYSRASLLKKLFKVSDFVTIHVDENQSSIGMVTEELVGLMKPGACLINTSRPSIVANNAILPHVTYISDFPKHVAGNTLEDRWKTDRIIIDEVRDYLKAQDSQQLVTPLSQPRSSQSPR